MNPVFEFYRGNDDVVADCLEQILASGDEEAIETSYTMIGYVRDPVRGLGERDLTYAMIRTWFAHDPVRAISALRQLPTSYGSWADIKYFCEYVRSRSMNDRCRDNAMIDEAINLLVHQLKIDRDTLNRGLRDNVSCRDRLSFAGKWTPREKGKFGWIFNRIVPSFGARGLRRLLSALNRELDTVQIKQCANQWSEIDPASVTPTTYINQRRAFLRVTNEDRSLCADNFANWSTITSSTHMCISDMVRFALREDRDVNMLNRTWSSMVGDKRRDSIIPIIDISCDLDTVLRHQFIGHGILLAQRHLGRLILADQTPVWIEANHSELFTDIVDRILVHMNRATTASLDRAFKLINDTLSMSATPSESITFHILSRQRYDNSGCNVVYMFPMDLSHFRGASICLSKKTASTI